MESYKNRKKKVEVEKNTLRPPSTFLEKKNTKKKTHFEFKNTYETKRNKCFGKEHSLLLHMTKRYRFETAYKQGQKSRIRS